MDRSKSGCHDVCISDLCITHVMIAGRPTHHQTAFPGKLRNGRSPPGDHHTISLSSQSYIIIAPISFSHAAHTDHVKRDFLGSASFSVIFFSTV